MFAFYHMKRRQALYLLMTLSHVIGYAYIPYKSVMEPTD